MPGPISLETAKAHLRVFHDDDDVIIEAYLAAAVEHVSGLLGAGEGGDYNPDSPSQRAAMLLILGDLYANREAQVVGSINSELPTMQALLHGSRRRVGV